MKGLIAALVVILIICAAFCIPMDKEDFLRIHIRADGNSEAEQNVKYLVKDAVVEYLAPLVAACSDVAESKQIVKNNLPQIKKVVENVLKQNGFDCAVTLSVKKENFPARSYGEISLSPGVYDSLIVNLGSGKGDNWWCVIYPPLCFVGAQANGTNAVRYRSKLLEIIREYFDAGN